MLTHVEQPETRLYYSGIWLLKIKYPTLDGRRPSDQQFKILEIKPNAVYTLEEAQSLLKISRSTMIRQIKKGAIRAAKIGVQYRILGRDLLHVLSPSLEEKARQVYYKGKAWAKEVDD